MTNIPPKHATFVAIAVSLVTMVMTMSMVFVMLEAIAADFGLTLRTVSWVVITEALVISSLLLPMGRLGDRVGRRRMHLTGLTVFAVGAVLAGLSTSFAFLIAARLVMATGNAMGQSVGTAMVVAAFPDEERGRAIGGQTTAVSIGGASGPILGGLLLQVLPWEALFLLLAIPASVAFVAGWFLLDDAVVSRGAERDAPFDGRGAVLAGVSVVALVLVLNDPFRLGWASPVLLAGAVGAAAALVEFVRWELRCPSPMLEMRLFAHPTFRLAVVARTLGFTVVTVVRFLLPVYLISLRGLAEGAAGSVLFLVSVGMGVAAQMSGRMSDRTGPWWPSVAGFVVLVVSTLAFAFVDASTSLWVVAVIVFVSGFGNGFWNVPVASTILGSVPPSSLGVIGAFTNLTRNLGNVVGQAVAATVVASVMAAEGFDVPLTEVGESAGAGDAFLAGWRTAVLIATALAVAATALAARARPADTSHRAEAAAPSDGAGVRR